MQRARVFFYVSLGILALTAAFNLGAQRAEGQAAGRQLTDLVWGSQTTCTSLLAVDSEGTFYVDCGMSGEWSAVGQLPGPAVSVFSYDPGIVTFVALANGDVYTTPKNQPGTFTFHSNVFAGAPVGSVPTTWGRIKADRR